MKTKFLAMALAMASGARHGAARPRPPPPRRPAVIRWDQAQRRFDAERAIYEREQARYEDRPALRPRRLRGELSRRWL